MTEKTEYPKLSDPKYRAFDFAAAERAVLERYAIDVKGTFFAADEPVRAPLRDTEEERQVVAPEHTREIFDPTLFATVVEWVIAEVKAAGYEAVAGSGHSGLPLVGAVAYRLGIPMIAVRKDDERPKGDRYYVNGILPHRPLRYAIIDDFICSGETIGRIDSKVAHSFPQATLAGLILYRVRADDPETRYSFVDECRSTIGRLLGRERASALQIHARHNLPY